MTKTIYPAKPYPGPKRMDKIMSKHVESVNSAGSVSWLVGVKEYAIAGKAFDTTQVNAIFAFVATNNSKVLFKNTRYDVQISNPTTALQRCNVYDIIARKDLSVIGSPAVCLQDTFSDYNKSGGTQSASAYQQIGFDPFTNSAFTQFFRVVKRTPLLLQGGQVHNHRVEYSCNKLFDKELSLNMSTGFKDFTIYTMIECHGTPENDSVTKTQVSLGAGRLNFVQTQTISMKYSIVLLQSWTLFNLFQQLSVMLRLSQRLLELKLKELHLCSFATHTPPIYLGICGGSVHNYWFKVKPLGYIKKQIQLTLYSKKYKLQ